MSQALDHVADTNGVELHRLNKLYEFPDFVKKANANDIRSTEVRAPAVYADYKNRGFPCHNAASTWVSNLFWQEKKAHYHPKQAQEIQQRLEGFNKYWGIKAAVDHMKERHTFMNKNADDQLPNSDFAYVWQDENGNTQRRNRIKNAMETKVAAEWLHQYRDHLPFGARNVIALKIMEKAARYGAGLGELETFIEKQAGHGVCDPSEVVAMITNRARLAKSPVHKSGIMKLAEMVQEQPKHALTPGQLIKLATTVDSIDRSLNLVGHYSATVPRPEDVIFKATYKTAQAGVDDACAMTSGTVYDKTDFGRIKLSDVQSLFGSGFANDVRSGLDDVDTEKIAELAATMPRDDAELFDKLAKSAGIKPIMSKNASAPESISADYIAAAAAAY